MNNAERKTNSHAPRAFTLLLARVFWGIVLACATLIPGCQKKLPTAPSDLTTGIVVYEHANYLGNSAHITADIKDLKGFRGPCEETDYSTTATGTPTSSTSHVWNDCISSIRVAPGWRAELYKDDDFSGDRHVVTEDRSNLQLVPGDCSHGGFNDCATSIRLIRP